VLALSTPQRKSEAIWEELLLLFGPRNGYYIYMTKYVINSGGIKHDLALKQAFHREIIKGLGANPTILLCNFAQVREDWEAKFPGYSNAIAEDMPDGVSPSFELAMPATFEAQCKDAAVIYFHGGDDHLLQYWMKRYDLPKLFADKVIATSSASSNMLATSFWTCDWRQCMDGLNVVPIKCIPHYLSDFGADDPRGPIDWQQAYDELAAYGDQSLPIHALKEGTFVVFDA
jgi:hypothetical protein